MARSITRSLNDGSDDKRHTKVSEIEESFNYDDQSSVVSHIDQFYTPTWRSKIWPNFDYPAKQRNTLFKLDFCVLFSAMFSTFIKYIDKSNLSAAYVSGMKEDLGVLGNELSYANTGYSIMSIVFGALGGYLMVKFNTRYFILAVEVVWTILTFAFAFIKTPRQMVILRTLIGIEGCHFAILMLIVGSYYKKNEMARRCNLVNAFTAIGPMCAFALQARALNSLDGVNGFKAWQWLFFLDTIISAVCIVLQFIVFPDILERLKPSWLWSQEEIDFLRSRLPPRNLDDNAKHLDKLTLQDIKNFLLDWRVYFIWACSVLGSFAQDPAQAIPFFFKGWNSVKPGTYSSEQINTLTIPAYAIQLLSSIITGWVSDVAFNGERWQTIIIGIAWSTVVCFFLATHKIFENAKGLMIFFFYNTTVAQAIAGQYWAEAQDLFVHDTKLRSFVTGGINPASGVKTAISGPFLYPSSKLPETYVGYYTSGGSCIAYIIMVSAYGYYKKVILPKKQLIKVGSLSSEVLTA